MATFEIPPEGISNVDEWLQARLGKVTASRVADVMRRTKTGWSAYRLNYRAELIAERLTGMAKEVYQSQAMIEGQQREADARARYAAMRSVEVQTPWFIEHHSIRLSGYSPDGVVGSDGLIEIKAPETKTHIQTLLTQEIDDDYMKQMQWGMACSRRQWCDFISYDPRIQIPQLRLYVQRVPRDDVMIAQMEEMVTAFLGEIDAAIKSLGEFELPKLAEATREPAAETGWSDNVPSDNFSTIESLLASGKLKKGM